VIIGVSHPLLDQLIDGQMGAAAARAGRGVIQIVKKAFGEKPALIVTGGDVAGVERAVSHTRRTSAAHLARGKDRTTIDDVEETEEIRGRPIAGGQAAMALYKIDKLGEQLRGKDSPRARARLRGKADDGWPRSIKTRAVLASRGLVDVAVAEPRRAERQAARYRRCRDSV
jgi:hypothetical protein